MLRPFEAIFLASGLLAASDARRPPVAVPPPGSQPAPRPGPGSCPTRGLVASSGTTRLLGDCRISGSVRLSGSAALEMARGVLSIGGDVSLGDDARLEITDGGLAFPQTGYGQYAIVLRNRSRLALTGSTFVTNGTRKNNFSMLLDAYDSSVADFRDSTLSTEGGSWLLGNFHDHAELNTVASRDLPTEIYPFDSSRISISSRSRVASLWIQFLPGSAATVDLPETDAEGYFSFAFGDAPGIGTSIRFSSSQGRLGFNSFPNSSVVVNGRGPAGTRDVDPVFGYFVVDNTSPVAIRGLTGGADVTRVFTDQGRRLQLNHVNLGPFAWQVYVSRSNGFPVAVTDSKINEIAALDGGLVEVSNCVLQLAVAGAFGAGSRMSISATHVWSQAVQAVGGGRIEIANGQLHGNFVSAEGAGSSITMTNVGESRNAVPPETCAPVAGVPPQTDGVPLCNPLNPLYACSQFSTKDGGTIVGAPPC